MLSMCAHMTYSHNLHMHQHLHASTRMLGMRQWPLKGCCLSHPYHMLTHAYQYLQAGREAAAAGEAAPPEHVARAAVALPRQRPRPALLLRSSRPLKPTLS